MFGRRFYGGRYFGGRYFGDPREIVLPAAPRVRSHRSAPLDAHAHRPAQHNSHRSLDTVSQRPRQQNSRRHGNQDRNTSRR